MWIFQSFILAACLTAGCFSYPLLIEGPMSTTALTGSIFTFICTSDDVLNIVDAYYGCSCCWPEKMEGHFVRVEPRYFTILQSACSKTSDCNTIEAKSALIDCNGNQIISQSVLVYYECTAPGSPEKETLHTLQVQQNDILQGTMCPYGSLVDIVSATLGVNSNTTRSDKPCTREVDETYYNLIVRKCQDRTTCDNLKALSYEIYCDGEQKTSQYMELEYQCLQTNFSQTCFEGTLEPPTVHPISLTCDGGVIKLDKEFTYYSRIGLDLLTPKEPFCQWSLSLFENIAEHNITLFNNWANQCNQQNSCHLTKPFWGSHLTISYVCEKGSFTTSSEAPRRRHEASCQDNQIIQVDKVRVGVTVDYDTLYHCMVPASVAYEQEMKENCNNKNSCGNILPPNDIIRCNESELYTNLAQTVFSCTDKVSFINQTCLVSSGGNVALSCPDGRNIYILEDNTVFGYTDTENDTCSDDVIIDCDVTVVDHFPDMFAEWKQACDNQNSCTLSVSPVNISTPCNFTCFDDIICNDSYVEATHVSLQYQCLDTSFSHTVAGELFTDKLCFNQTVIDIKEAKYGVFKVVGSQLQLPNLEEDCQKHVDSDYLIDIKDSCNGRHFCGNLKALSYPIYCEGQRTYTDYVMLYYSCVYGNPTDPPTDPPTSEPTSMTTIETNVTEGEIATTVDPTSEVQTTHVGNMMTTITSGLSSPITHTIVAIISAVVSALIVIVICLLLSKNRKKSAEPDPPKTKTIHLQPMEEIRYEATPISRGFYESVEDRQANQGTSFQLAKPAPTSQSELEDPDPKHGYVNHAAIEAIRRESQLNTNNDRGDVNSATPEGVQPQSHESMVQNDEEDGNTDWVDVARHRSLGTKPAKTSFSQSPNNMVDNTYYDGNDEACIPQDADDTTVPTGEMVENNYYSQDYGTDKTTEDDMVENNYYGQEFGGDKDEPQSDMVENNYYGGDENSEEFIENNYYDSQQDGNYSPGKTNYSGSERFDGSSEHYYDLQEYKPTVHKPVGGTKKKPMVPKKPKPSRGQMDKHRSGDGQENYVYTYQHFDLERRSREPKRRDSQI